MTLRPYSLDYLFFVLQRRRRTYLLPTRREDIHTASSSGSIDNLKSDSRIRLFESCQGSIEIKPDYMYGREFEPVMPPSCHEQRNDPSDSGPVGSSAYSIHMYS